MKSAVKTFTGKVTPPVIGIGNGRQAGGGQQLCPNALINDGLLQLRILPAMKFFRLSYQP